MIVHEQRSDRSRVWFDAVVVDNADGTLSIPATAFWLRGTEHLLPAYSPDVGNGPFRLWIEKTGADADYVLDLTGEAEPASFGKGTGAPLIVWREGTETHVLRSVEIAA